MSHRHRNKDKKEKQERVPDIFKDLWGFDFIESVSFSKVKGEMPKIRIVVARENEHKVALIKDLLLKYEFPFSNFKTDWSGDKKESEPKTNISGPGPSFMSVVDKLSKKGNGKPNSGKNPGGNKRPPFKCI